jgi:hypothetical protein
MKTRPVLIFSGQPFEVPQCIQRIDSRSTHGWQVRYQGTRMYSDHSRDGSGAAAALARATAELKRRIAQLPAPSKLQRQPSGHKRSDLPVGISGPIVRQRGDSGVRTAVLSVLLPQFGKPVRCSTVYIGTENTYTVARYYAAVERAKALRQAAEAQYHDEETRARRKAGRQMRVSPASAATPRAPHAPSAKQNSRRAAGR